MAVKLRLMRMGKKKQPTYRIVASDSRSARDGRFIEIIGTYAPREDPSLINVDRARALDWLGKGAQPTDTVKKLLEIDGAWGEFITEHPKRKVKTIVAKPAAVKAVPAPVETPAPTAVPAAESVEVPVEASATTVEATAPDGEASEPQ